MDKLTITIETDSAAFRDDDTGARNAEIARILRALSDRVEVESGWNFPDIKLIDVNGNVCGFTQYE